jgi:hypothetical protein
MARKSKTHKKRASRRRQTGGGGWGYTGSLQTAAGAPLENRVSYEHCYDDMRVAPAVGTPTLWGGYRKARSRRQQGGACGDCAAPQALLNQAGGGAGTGGYSLTYDNSIGKVYAEAVKAPCPSQAGGGSIYEHVAYPASYGYDRGSAYLSSSAHFLEPKAGVTHCASGGRRRTKRHRRRRHTRRH